MDRTMVLVRHRVALLACLLAVSAVASPGVVRAATVSVRSQSDASGTFVREIPTFAAAPGERNVLDARAVTDDTAPGGAYWMFSDAGAPLAAGPGCASLDAHTARCTSSGTSMDTGSVDLGDGDDHLSFTVGFVSGLFLLPSLVADGGPGDDRMAAGVAAPVLFRGGDGFDELFGSEEYASNVLEGGPGPDLLVGGAEDDALDGGGGGDRLYAGAGDDRLTDGQRDGATGSDGPSLDILDGGPGRDTVSYANRRRPVVVDLRARQHGGEQDEDDRLSGIESAIGGHGADVLAGNGRRNVLDGRGGHDRLLGRGGNDLLRPGGDVLSCGRGADTVAGRPSGPRDLLPPSCELVGYSDGYSDSQIPAYPTVLTSRTVGYPVHCPVTEDGIERCSGTLRLREMRGHHRLLASGRFPPGFWRAGHVVRARLTPLGRRLAARRAAVPATVAVTGLTLDASTAIRWSIRLRIPAGTARR